LCHSRVVHVIDTSVPGCTFVGRHVCEVELRLCDRCSEESVKFS